MQRLDFGWGFLQLRRVLRAPSLGTGACLVCLDVGAVYADVLQVGVLAKFMEDLLDQAAFRPLLEPLVHRLPWAVPLRQVAPGRSASGNPEDAVSAFPWVPASGDPCHPSAALENRAADAPIRRLSVRTVE